MIAAPFSAALLADFGAEVIKVEVPGSGDTLRNVAPMYANRSLYWSVLGRNKCSITLDLRVPRGRELFLELVERSDAILENFRPGTLERWDLGYDDAQGRQSGHRPGARLGLRPGRARIATRPASARPPRPWAA